MRSNENSLSPLRRPRRDSEFRYGGDASRQRPAHGTGDLKTWHDYYFTFDNPKGPHTEHWQHVLGCRQWFKPGPQHRHQRDQRSGGMTAFRRLDSGGRIDRSRTAKLHL
jgi:heterotetrameric sarcosine oxidase delta subunit